LAPQAPASLFPGLSRVDGSEIKFRAVCALGCELVGHLAELRLICDLLPHGLDVVHWIDHIEAKAIDDFTGGDATTWPSSISAALSDLTTKAKVKSFPALVTFFHQLAGCVTGTTALDPAAQLSALNLRGFTLAAQMIGDPDWSTDLVRSRWNKRSAQRWEFREDTAGNFQPVTAMDKMLIELRVNTGKFDLKNSLLFYLTLEFQMMHEYISHLLPAWNSGNALEEEFLLAMMFLYYRECGPRNGLVSLVREADERRADRHRPIRQFIKDELAPGQEQRLSQLLLELAVLEESDMKAAEKRHLLALLKKVPLQEDAQLRRSIQSWIRQDDAPALYQRLRTALG
jgi:hypothetical protein